MYLFSGKNFLPLFCELLSGGEESEVCIADTSRAILIENVSLSFSTKLPGESPIMESQASYPCKLLNLQNRDNL